MHHVTRVYSDIVDAVGSTPLLELTSLAEGTGCKILAKAEFFNPAGSVKDRAAKYMILDAEERGILDRKNPANYCVYEATGGNTGVALAMICARRGYKCYFTHQTSASEEKLNLIRRYGAETELCKEEDPDSNDHYELKAKNLAKSRPGGYFTNQCQNPANPRAHFETTGPEIWEQTGGQLDGFICTAGTGGTIGGVGKYLKKTDTRIQVWLVDPEGSGNITYLKSGKFRAPEGSTFAEGSGSTWLTTNFERAVQYIDDGVRCTNKEMAQMIQFLVENEGLLIGPSAAMNVVGAVKMARRLGRGKTVVTTLADFGDRYGEHVLREDFAKKHGYYFRNVPRDLSWITEAEQ